MKYRKCTIPTELQVGYFTFRTSRIILVPLTVIGTVQRALANLEIQK